MSLLDEDIIGLEDPKCIIKLMRSWASGGDYWSQKTRSQYESCIDKCYLMELSIKYYQYNQEEREWMEKNDIKYMPVESWSYLNFNPYVPDDMIISLWLPLSQFWPHCVVLSLLSLSLPPDRSPRRV